MALTGKGKPFTIEIPTGCDRLRSKKSRKGGKKKRAEEGSRTSTTPGELGSFTEKRGASNRPGLGGREGGHRKERGSNERWRLVGIQGATKSPPQKVSQLEVYEARHIH